jgi:hypothetical protein
MQIAVLHGSMDTRPVQSGNEAMQWFEVIARTILIAVVVLIGAAVVRNVTDALTMATHVTIPQQTAQR